MPLQIIRNDITKVKADAIVNTANPKPVVGAGTDTAVYKAAGEQMLLAARKRIGDIAPGQAVETPAYNLDAKFIIHTVCVAWNDGKSGEFDVLSDCYFNSLTLAADLGCKSVAFPLIGTGSYRFPREDAIGIAKDIIEKFLFAKGSSMDVMLVLFDKESVKSGESLADKIKAYIDDNYVENAVVDEYGFTAEDLREMSALKRRRERFEETRGTGNLRMHRLEVKSPEDAVLDVQKSFTERLFEFAEERGVKDSELYGGKYERFFSKQALSKMRADRDYHPSKYVSVVVCLVLRLNLHETLDLLERAGFTLSHSRKADIVVRACIENGVYDVYKVNAKLEEYGCETLRQIK